MKALVLSGAADEGTRARWHIITSGGRGRIQHAFEAVGSDDSREVLAFFRLRILAVAHQLGILDKVRAKAALAENLLVLARQQLAKLQHETYKAMQICAKRRGKPMVRPVGRPRKLPPMRDGGDTYRAMMLPDDERMGAAQLLDGGDEVKKWNSW